MKPEVTTTETEIAVTYPDGMSWTWPRHDDEARILSGRPPFEHTCAPTTCKEHSRRFNQAWGLMVDVIQADKGLPPLRQR